MVSGSSDAIRREPLSNSSAMQRRTANGIAASSVFSSYGMTVVVSYRWAQPRTRPRNGLRVSSRRYAAGGKLHSTSSAIEIAFMASPSPGAFGRCGSEIDRYCRALRSVQDNISFGQ
jgi:hypothetical protein